MVRRVLGAALAFGVMASGAGAQTPCTGIDRALPAAQLPALDREVAAQMGVQKAAILQSFRLGSWRILYVETYVADEAFLFYPRDPAVAKYATLWAGAAMPTEEASIDQWTLKNAPGIPKALAACFAWHVTQDRDQ